MRIALWIIFLFHIQPCIAQDIKPQALWGKWKVTKWEWFNHVSPKDFDDFKQEKVKCLKSIVTINKNGITIPRNACYYYPCNGNFYAHPVYLQVNIIDDHKLPKQEDAYPEFYEAIDSNIVSKKFVNLIDNHYSKNTLTIIETGCFVDWGKFTLKICVINKNKIALYSSADLIVLERIK